MSSIDTHKFSTMIKSKRGNDGLRTIANEIGVSASTLSRVEKGNLPDIETYLILCKWLDVSPSFFTIESNSSESESVQSGIIAHLRADKVLPPATTKALIEMINLAYESTKTKGTNHV